MWIPWSLVLLFSIYISKKVAGDTVKLITDKRYLLIGVSTFVLYLIFYIYNLDMGKSLNFYNHKYPPDLYYLLFGISLTCFSLVVARLKIWQNTAIKKIYFFISNNSYQIFFIHYIVLDAVLLLSKNNLLIKNPAIQFAIIFSASILLAIGINKFKRLIKVK
jgi:peptidoglycan/LPS O-acetylase OafA/YrhL